MNTVLSLIIMLSQNNLKRDSTIVISRFIIDHISELNDMTITQMAKGCYTSTTSIIKYYELLGFNSYGQFKKNLLSGIQTRKLQLIEKNEGLDINDLVNQIKYISSEEVNTEEFYNSIEKCVDYIYENKKLHFYGAIFPLALTLSFIEDMAIMGIPTHIHQMNYGMNRFNDLEGLHMIMTLSGRFMKFHKSTYMDLCTKDSKAILISQDIKDTNHLLMNIHVPKTRSYDYSELILLIILDLIKAVYYKKYG